MYVSIRKTKCRFVTVNIQYLSCTIFGRKRFFNKSRTEYHKGSLGTQQLFYGIDCQIMFERVTALLLLKQYIYNNTIYQSKFYRLSNQCIIFIDVCVYFIDTIKLCILCFFLYICFYRTTMQTNKMLLIVLSCFFVFLFFKRLHYY